MNQKSKGTYSLRDAPCRCGAATYRFRTAPWQQAAHRRCDDCDLTVAHCRCIVRLIVHMCPPGDEGYMPCCGLSPFEAMSDRMTLDPRRVNCKGGAA